MNYALVTGGSRGIGRAICVKLATMGYKVIINYVSNQTEAEKTLDMIQEIGGQGELLAFDVSNQEATANTLETWKQVHEGEYIAVIVNNSVYRLCRIYAMICQ